MIKKSEALSIYIDESGYTGHNYLDKNQPIFTMASSNVDPNSAKNLLKDAFPNYQANEFKFSSIWNSSNQNNLLELFNSIENVGGEVFTYVIDKYYAVLVKMVDWLIEPQVTNAGYDFYKNGYNRKLVNHIYFGMTEIEKKDVLSKLVVAYQDFSRSPDIYKLKNLQKELLLFKNEVELVENKQYLEQMFLGAEFLPNETDIEEFKSTNELHLTTMLSIISWWRKKTDKDLIVYHDHSSNFNRDKETWNAITSSSVKPFLHPLGDGTFVQYPLRVTATYSVNSKENYSIQLSDIIAGVFSKFFSRNNNHHQKDLLNKIKAKSNMVYDGILPGKDFPKGLPELKRGFDAVDNMSNLIQLPKKMRE